MSIWDKIKDPCDYNSKKKKQLSEVAMRHAEANDRMVAMDAATSPPLVIPSAASWVGAAAGVASMSSVTITGTSTTAYDPDVAEFCGFERDVLLELHQVLLMNELTQYDLRDIVETYCRVKRRVDK